MTIAVIGGLGSIFARKIIASVDKRVRSVRFPKKGDPALPEEPDRFLMSY